MTLVAQGVSPLLCKLKLNSLLEVLSWGGGGEGGQWLVWDTIVPLSSVFLYL